MGMISRMDHTGDTLMAEYTAADEISVEKAREVFNQMVKEGHLMVRVDEGTAFSGEKLKEFDPAAERIVAFKQLVGG
jgi:polyhydroxyalkanoate synthesis regulator phasin